MKFKKSVRSKMNDAARQFGIDMTRREFMRKTMDFGCAAGILPYFLESIFLHKVAHAETNDIAMIQINCSGGAGFQNWFPAPGPEMVAAGALNVTANAANLFQMTNGGRAVNIGDPSQMNKLPFMVDDSPWTAGLRQGIGSVPEIYANLLYAMVASVTSNDTNQNPNSQKNMITKAGFSGSLGPVVRTFSSDAGINAQNVIPDPTSTSLFARNAGAIVNAPQFLKGFTVSSNLNDTHFLKLAQGANRISAAELSVLGTSVNQNFADIHSAAYASLPSISQRPAGAANADINLGLNSLVATVLGVPVANQNDAFKNLGSVAALQQEAIYATLKGFFTAGMMDMQGYDYHNEQRTGVEIKETAVGLLVGQIIRAAHELNRPVYIVLTTDGGVLGDQAQVHPVVGTSQKFQGDFGPGNRTLLFLYDRLARYELVKGTLGNVNYNTAFSDSNTPVGNARGAAAATFATYLAMTDRLGDLGEIMKESTISAEDLSKIANGFVAFRKRSG